ncbi:hypothetical protein CN918_28935 [Priestia megaterium]|nr:hypothetical protein CN918_28935 [Priestia megaterium]
MANNNSEVLNIGEDLETYLNKFVEEMTKNHLEFWKDRYHYRTSKEAAEDFKKNYNATSDIEFIQNGLQRKLTDKEKDYFKERMADKIHEIFNQNSKYNRIN